MEQCICTALLATQLPRSARTHSFKHKLALPVLAALAARAAATHLPLAAERPPSNTSLPAGLHKQTRYRRARAISKHGCRPVTQGDLVPHYLHHNSITIKHGAGR